LPLPDFFFRVGSSRICWRQCACQTYRSV